MDLIFPTVFEETVAFFVKIVKGKWVSLIIKGLLALSLLYFSALSLRQSKMNKLDLFKVFDRQNRRS